MRNPVGLALANTRASGVVASISPAQSTPATPPGLNANLHAVTV